MARVRRSVLVCDVCLDPDKPVKKYALRRDEEVVRTVRCAVHGALFEYIFTHAQEVAAHPAGR
ncbi:hypothetical protein AB0I95_14870 [Micromonospora sp. NPDC049751]|uniref:hypothetical protein n=1 Tax=Micromonospora sp. NPDC049751 TaxID=3154837 RepID=UPI0033C5F03F